MKFKLDFSKLRIGAKVGKQKNALNFPYTHKIDTHNLNPDSSPFLSTSPLVQGMPGEKTNDNWLDVQRIKENKALVVPSEQVLEHHQLIFERYNPLITNLLTDLAGAAKWNRLGSRSQLLTKQGDTINGWGWVIYRVHSAGEAVLPEDPTPQRYTLFNFWQVTFDCATKDEFKPDYKIWNLYAKDTLEDFDRLLPGAIESWLKEQLYQMYKIGCMWIALPNLMDEKGKLRKPTIQDALYTFNMLSFGRNYDPYHTEKHFYDRPPYNNQFIPGYYKR